MRFSPPQPTPQFRGIEKIAFQIIRWTFINIRRHALVFGSQKINIHQSGKEFEPKAQNVMPGSADLCFLTDEKVENVLQAFKEAKMEVREIFSINMNMH
jgi:hypothetical protein